MSKTPRRLGRGLDSLVSSIHPVTETPPTSTTRQTDATPGTKPTSLNINELRPNPYQPRKEFDQEAIQALTDSIRHSGVLQPIAVRRKNEAYEIIAGERRWTAARNAGLQSVPVILRQASEEEMLELALIENIQREDLNAIDRAKAYQQFCDQFEIKPAELAQRLGEHRSTVVNYLRLLELQTEIQDVVAKGLISMGHARSLLSIDDPEKRRGLAKRAAMGELSVRQLENMARVAKQPAPVNTEDPKVTGRNLHVKTLEQRFEQAVKTKVSIHESPKKGRGKIVLEYYNLDDFERLAGILGVGLE